MLGSPKSAAFGARYKSAAWMTVLLLAAVALAPRAAGAQTAPLRAGGAASIRQGARSETVNSAAALADYVNIRELGACGNNICDDTAAVRKALAAYPNGRVRIHFPTGIYLITDTILVSKDRVILEGDGRQATIIHFVPAAAKTLFVFKKAGADIVQCGISGMGLWGDNPQTKVGIQLVSTSETHISDIATYPWTGPDSIGIQIQGHDFGIVSDVEITAPQPITIEKNTNNAIADAGIDIDHFEFQGLYLIGDHAHPLITVADGVNLTNVTFDGRQAWAFGTHGFYFKDSSTVRAGLNLVFKNVRWEQSIDADGYLVYLSLKSGFYNVSFENMYSGNLRYNCGYYLRNVQLVSFTNVIYAGTGMGLDIASKDVSNVSFRNTFFQTGSTVNTAGASTLEGTYQVGGVTYTQAPNSPVFKFNPSVLAGINQMESVPIPAIAGGRAAIGTEIMIGTLYITDGISGVSGSFVLAGGFHAVAKVSDPFSHFNAGQSAAPVFNVYWSDAQKQYEIENRTPNTAQFYMTLIGRGEH